MKFIFFRYNKKGKNKRSRSGNPWERFLFLCCVGTFSALILFQVGLANPYTRTFLSAGKELEGTPLETEEFLYNEGKLSLGLVGEDRNQDVKVLVNGDEVSAFSYGLVEINVKDGDVVEIDGSKTRSTSEVEVLSKSDNVSTQCVGKRVKVGSGTNKLVRVKVNK